jgi:hypothetical protein
MCCGTPQDVKPGKARVIKCLMESMAQPNFGEECRAELAKREKVVKNDYRCVGITLCVWTGNATRQSVAPLCMTLERFEVCLACE